MFIFMNHLRSIGVLGYVVMFLFIYVSAYRYREYICMLDICIPKNYKNTFLYLYDKMILNNKKKEIDFMTFRMFLFFGI